jgi:carboxymethylenebutenolidase
MQTTTVDVSTDDGIADAYLVQPNSDGQPDGDGPHPAVLLFMDAIGLRPQIQQMAERIAARGYVVLAPNTLYRGGRSPLFGYVPDLADPEARAEFMQKVMPMVRSMTPEGTMRDSHAYLGYLAGLHTVAPGPVALTGYCMGGRLAFRTAGIYPDRVAAAASFHGGNLATDSEDSPHLLADRIQAELYFGHADNDRSIPPEQIALLEKALDAADVRYRSELYSGAIHGFTMADTSAYNAEAADRHWTNLFDLLDRALPGARGAAE